MSSRILKHTLNHHVLNAKYAVRGEIVAESQRLAKQFKNKDNKLPFQRLINCNIGNPQQLEQQPISFLRDVLSLTLNPSLQTRCEFPSDVVARANHYMNAIPSMGAYTDR